MNLIIEGARTQGEESYSVTIKLTGIPDAQTCEAMTDIMARAVAMVLYEMGADNVELVTSH